MGKLKLDFQAKFEDEEWDFVEDNLCGLTVHSNTVFINPNHKGKEMMGSWLHELCHVIDPDLSEAEVVKREKFMAEVLWKAGYRRVSKKDKKPT